MQHTHVVSDRGAGPRGAGKLDGTGRRWGRWARRLAPAAVALAGLAFTLSGARPAAVDAQTAQSVTIFNAINYGGASRVITAHDAHLGNSGFNEIVSSLRLSAGTKVAVYEHPNYTGVCEVLTASDPDLRNNSIGNDRISSLRLGEDCQVQLAEGEHYTSTTRMIMRDIPDLRVLTGTSMNDGVSSIRVPAGKKVAVYEHINYGGICENLTADDPDLRNNPIGADRISSIRLGVDCPPQVVLYEDMSYGGAFRVLHVGTSLGFDKGHNELRGTDWENRASSVHVTGGAHADLYRSIASPTYNSAGEYIGATDICTRLWGSDPDLSNNFVGDDKTGYVIAGTYSPPPGTQCANF
jgi:hypothetical protein